MATQHLEPHFEDIQHHYDLSEDFYRLFLDPTQTYSCAYFERDDMTLEEAQLAKIDLALGKLGLRPGMTLLDIGCGWGATLKRALQHQDVNVVGLTLSRNQAMHVQDLLLHTIIRPSNEDYAERKLPILMRHVRFTRFITTEIFPGGDLPQPKDVIEHAAAAGFSLRRQQSLRLHYARTLECWAAALEANREAALEIQSQEVYDRYMKYLTGCVELFREGYIDVCQFTLAKSA